MAFRIRVGDRGGRDRRTGSDRRRTVLGPHQAKAAQTTRAELRPLAEAQIPLVFGYDYQTVEGSLTDAYNLLTPEYRREFESRATDQIIPEARERQVVSQANVVGVRSLTPNVTRGRSWCT